MNILQRMVVAVAVMLSGCWVVFSNNPPDVNILVPRAAPTPTSQNWTMPLEPDQVRTPIPWAIVTYIPVFVTPTPGRPKATKSPKSPKCCTPMPTPDLENVLEDDEDAE